MRKLALYLVLAGMISAQLSVNGTVTDVEGQPLAGVQVFLKDTYLGTTTNLEL